MSAAPGWSRRLRSAALARFDICLLWSTCCHQLTLTQARSGLAHTQRRNKHMWQFLRAELSHPSIHVTPKESPWGGRQHFKAQSLATRCAHQARGVPWAAAYRGRRATGVCVCARGHVRLCVSVCGCERVYICVCVSACLCTCVYVHVFMCRCVCWCLCVCACVCACKHIRSRAPNSSTFRGWQGCENGTGQMEADFGPQDLG